MLSMKTSFNIDSKRWDNIILSLGGYFHDSSIYAQYRNHATPQNDLVFFSWKDEHGNIVGIAVGSIERSSWPLLRNIKRRLVLHTNPLVREPITGKTRNDFLLDIEMWAKKFGCYEIFVNSFESGNRNFDFKKLGYDVIERYEFIVDLSLDEEGLWKLLSHARRKNIKKALRNGVKIQQLYGDLAIRALRSMQKRSAVRVKARAGVSIARDYEIGDDPVNILLENGVGQIYGAFIENRLISAGLFTEFGDTVYYLLSGHDVEALKTQGPTLLVWTALLNAKMAGCRWFNLSGCKKEAELKDHSEHGVYAYKKGFGGEQVKCAGGRKILNKKKLTLFKFFSKW